MNALLCVLDFLAAWLSPRPADFRGYRLTPAGRAALRQTKLP